MKHMIFLLTLSFLFALYAPPLAKAAEPALPKCGTTDITKVQPENVAGQPVDSEGKPIDPLPFVPDLGYAKIKNCLPTSIFDAEGASAETILGLVLAVFSIIITFLAMLGLIVSGIMFITAGSDPDKAKKAKANIIWIIIGIVLYILSFMILPVTRSVLTDIVSRIAF